MPLQPEAPMVDAEVTWEFFCTTTVNFLGLEPVELSFSGTTSEAGLTIVAPPPITIEQPCLQERTYEGVATYQMSVNRTAPGEAPLKLDVAATLTGDAQWVEEQTTESSWLVSAAWVGTIEAGQPTIDAAQQAIRVPVSSWSNAPTLVTMAILDDRTELRVFLPDRLELGAGANEFELVIPYEQPGTADLEIRLTSTRSQETSSTTTTLAVPGTASLDAPQEDGPSDETSPGVGAVAVLCLLVLAIALRRPPRS